MSEANKPVAAQTPSAPNQRAGAANAPTQRAAPAPPATPKPATEVQFAKPAPQATASSAASSLGRGLDIGTMFVVGAKDEGGKTQFTSIRDAFFTLENNDLLVDMMNKADVDHVIRGGEVVVIGDKSIEFANTFRAELRRPLQDGVISPKEKDAFGIIELILKKAVGEASKKGETCCFSVPADAIDKDGSSTVFHQGMFSRFVESLGYSPKPLNEAEAIAYSELAGDKLTGLALSFGAGMVNACFIMLGVPYLKFAVARSGEWIDKNAAAASNSTIAAITALKESGEVDILAPSGWEANALSMYYAALIKYVCLNLHRQVVESAKLPRLKEPIKIVVSGGTSCMRGFRQMFEGEFRKLDWPFEISSIVSAKDPMNAVANGCLVAARLAEKGA